MGADADETVEQLAERLAGYISAPTEELRREHAHAVAQDVFRQRQATLRLKIEQGSFDFSGLLKDIEP